MEIETTEDKTTRVSRDEQTRMIAYYKKITSSWRKGIYP